MQYKELYRLTVASLAILGGVACMTAARPVVKMTVDSSAILMGRTTSLQLTVNDENATDISRLILQPDSAATAQNGSANVQDAGNVILLTPGVEVVEGFQNPALNKGASSGKNILTSTIKIQSFDSGDYVIPPVLYTNGHDTVLSNSVALRVYPVDTVTVASDLAPMSTILPPYKRKLGDYLPDWLVDYWLYIVIGIVIILGGVCAYLLFSRKVTIKLPQKKAEPPYNVAVAKLAELRAEQLCERGLQKEFYTRLTDILREYLDRRFNINAMEMTSTQIRHALNASKDEIMSKELVEQVLEIADFVKFAKAQPLGDDNVKAFESARRFVEDTKPTEKAADGKEKPDAQPTEVKQA